MSNLFFWILCIIAYVILHYTHVEWCRWCIAVYQAISFVNFSFWVCWLQQAISLTNLTNIFQVHLFLCNFSQSECMIFKIYQFRKDQHWPRHWPLALWFFVIFYCTDANLPFSSLQTGHLVLFYVVKSGAVLDTQNSSSLNNFFFYFF